MLNFAYISSSRTLAVSGEASRTNGELVSLRVRNSDEGIRDNDLLRTLVASSGVVGQIRNFDFSGITNAGVHLLTYDLEDNRLTGTSFGDWIRSLGDGRSTVIAGAGDDRVETGIRNDSVNGGSGNDWIDAGSGDDSIRGGSGDDTILGGDGVDVVYLYGDFGEYVLEIVDGDYRLTHLGGAGVDGVDLIGSAEFLQFRDQRVALDPIPSELAASYAASTRTVTMSGEAARSGRIEVRAANLSAGYTVEIHDSNLSRTLVPLALGTALPLAYDFSGVRGAGIDLDLRDSQANRITGSNGDDRIWSRYGSKDIIIGGAGNDEITTDGGNGSINGGYGDDTIRAGWGDDSLRGSFGNDRIDGGRGIDTLHLVGNRDEYAWELVDGDYRLVHNGGSGADGIDIVANVEFFQFRDQRVAIDPDVSALQASYDQATRTVTVSGDAAVAGGDPVFMYRSGFGLEILDNDFGEGRVNQSFSNQPRPRIYDFSGITNAGVVFNDTNYTATRIIGTAFDDELTASLGSNTSISGGGGNDVLRAHDSDDSLNGGTGNDTIYAGGGNDTIRGGRGDDAIDGGNQTDTLYLYGNRAEYALDMFEGNHRLTHLGGSGTDGTDLFVNVEYLQFADQRVAVGDWMMA